ncbi:transcriptional regulator, AraC family [Bradyrhizobium lablabi]|uniref:Transcriptional regulator, AraC family n=1 Tax=Bradyrhizobium lablabi TaxID=722472 RepID=A0A1M6T2H3_9BRAD|nr:helix-turn-helix domain-containing protein [Bradyrhizobium lablabi]SHK51109.1 transcriptional regulator, AraC family [Bradyrhizobium lablabi]
MLQSNGVEGTPLLDYEAWRASLRTICGRYSPQGVERDAFQGWARRLNVCGLAAADIGWNARRIERTYRDARLDGMEHYYVRIQVSGKSAMIQNDQARRIAVGDVVLVDAARPVTYFGNNASARWVSLHLPRQSLISHLGFEPQGGFCRRGTPAGRFLHEVVVDALKGEGSSFSAADSYMQLAVYDLVGALFAPSDTPPISRSTDKLFARICGVIKDSLSDPDFGPVEAAAEVGISLRYVQKLFMERGATCSGFIYTLRLDRAAHLLHRRALLRTGQPLSEIAYACGFRDYAHFARRFRHRFRYSPGAHAGNSDGIVRAGTDESASLTHDVQAPES